MNGAVRFALSRLALCGLALLLTSSSPAATIDLASSRDATVMLENDDQGFLLELGFSTLESFDVETEHGLFTQISVPGFSHSTRLGEPKLPVLRRIIAVPLGADVSARIVRSNVETIGMPDRRIEHPILPAQPSLRKDQSPQDVAFVYDAAAYTRAGYPDRPLVEVEEAGILRGLRLFVLTIEPVRYDPVARVIEIHNDLQVALEFESGDLTATDELRRTTYSPYFESIYSQFVLNYRRGPSLDDDLTRYPVRYVIVSDPMFEAQLAPFIEWKEKKGFDVIVGYTDDPQVGSTTTSIRSWIHGLYNSAAGTPEDPKPSFVLFVGDVNLIPAFSGDTDSHITDLDYVDVSGSDYMPEMYYGRFSARNPGELQPQIDKTLEYERYEMPDPSFLGEVVMIAGVDASHADTWGNGQINYGTSNYFNAAHGILSHTYLYPASGSSSAQIIQDVSDGVGYCNYTAHGGTTSWSNPSFTISDINGLANEHEYPTVVGNCCLTNSFQVETCFGEAWLRAADKGSIGYIGGTNSTYWDEDFWWGVGSGTISANPTYAGTGPGAYDGMFHDHGESFPQWYTCQYAFIMAGNLAVVEGGGSDDYYWEIYALMGDPSLSTYFGVPSGNTVSHTNQVFIGTGSLTVNADPYSYAALSLDGVLLAAGLVDAAGQVILNFTPFASIGTADLVITRQNRVPYQGTIDVIPNSGPYVVLQSHTPTSCEYDQTTDLDIVLHNVGTATAYSVNAQIALTDPYVTIVDGIESLGTIGPDATASANSAFRIVTPGYVPDEHVLRFEMTISGSAREQWTSTMDVIVHAPVMSAGNCLVNDQTGGNGNGRLDPGESVLLTVPISNGGHAASPAATAILSTTNPNVTITDDFESLGSVGPGGSANAVFSVSVSPSTPVGTPVSFTCDLDAGEYDVTDNFILQVGLDLEDFEAGDFTLYPWIHGGDGVWTITAVDPYEGVYSAKSGDITHDETSDLSIFAEWVEAGNISFYYKVSSEDGYDYLRFFIDGVEQAAWDGIVDWTFVSFPVDAGGHTFLWQYDKDYSVDEGEDCAWLDYIIFPPFSTPRYPDITWAPGSITRSQPPDAIDQETISVGNSGDGDLIYSVVVQTQCPQAASAPHMKLAKGQADPRRGSRSLDDAGGPDGYGYGWIDSDEPSGATFHWIDISGVGTAVADADDGMTTGVDLGFSMDFYGTAYSTINICTNGFLTFTSTATSYTNQPIPESEEPNAVIAPFWDDLNPIDGGTVYYWSDAANDRFIVQWDAVEHWGSIVGTYTFEAILHEDGRIIFQYLTMSGTVDLCTIGIENQTGSDGLEILFNDDYVHDNLAIIINPPCGWLTVSPDDGTILSGAPDHQLHAEFNTTGMVLGEYSANIWINSNDPDESAVVIPVALTVMPPAPDPVTDLTIRAEGSNVRLRWSESSGAGSYQIWRGQDPEFDTASGTLLGTTTGNAFLVSVSGSEARSFFFVIAQY